MVAGVALPWRRNGLAALVARVARADARAFEAVYRLTAPRLFGIALGMCGDPVVAEDALEEAYVALWYRAGDPPVRNDAAGWLIATVRERCLARVEARGAEPLPASVEDLPAWPISDLGLAPDAMLAAGAASPALGACIEAMADGPRRAVAVALFHGLSRAELAAALGASRATVGAWLRRGLASLARCAGDASID